MDQTTNPQGEVAYPLSTSSASPRAESRAHEIDYPLEPMHGNISSARERSHSQAAGQKGAGRRTRQRRPRRGRRMVSGKSDCTALWRRDRRHDNATMCAMCAPLLLLCGRCGCHSTPTTAVDHDGTRNMAGKVGLHMHACVGSITLHEGARGARRVRDDSAWKAVSAVLPVAAARCKNLVRLRGGKAVMRGDRQ